MGGPEAPGGTKGGAALPRGTPAGGAAGTGGAASGVGPAPPSTSTGSDPYPHEGAPATRIVVIGGTGFIGSRVARRLCALGHEVAVFHRGGTPAAGGPRLTEILGDERDLAAYRDRFAAFAPDAAVHMLLGDLDGARRFAAAFRHVARRAIVVSSMDVYRAYDRYRRRDPGPPDAVPLPEDGPLRDRLYPYLADGEVPTSAEYDKIVVERLLAAERAMSCTVVRLPMVYGPGDAQHRFRPWLRRMADRRPAILLDAARSGWRGSFGYVSDVADAIALAAADGRAEGRTYNAGEERAHTVRDWIVRFGAAVGWTGRVVEAPVRRLAPSLVLDRDFSQHWVVDTARIRRELGFAERTAPAEALRATAEWEIGGGAAGAAPGSGDYAAEDAALAGM